MKRLILAALFALLALPVHARDSFQGALQVQPAHPSLYSFADIYRLTVTGQAPAMPLPAADSPMRVVATQPAVSSDVQFSVRTVREPQRWALLIAGLLLAGWVARRRMNTLL